MTIAACYVSPEGVVFGADSTASLNTAGGFHFFNHNQKLFELGEDATLAVVTWGLGGFGELSHRTLFAEFADDLKAKAPTNLQEVADRWASKAWSVYSTHASLAGDLARFRILSAQPPYDPQAQTAVAGARTEREEEEFKLLSRALVAGYCIGGYLEPARRPQAYEIVILPSSSAAPTPVSLGLNHHRFWGAPSLTHRLLIGCDDEFLDRLKRSGKWTGTDQDLLAILQQGVLQHPVLPIRDAIDFVHTCIYSTIKGLKFSAMPQVCGGPVELAVITSDRKFRWVRHKEWDAAVWENG
jgi:hypothetical protein